MSNEKQILMRMDGFDDCVIGLVTRYGQDSPCICYDTDLVISKLMLQGMTREEAEEFFAHNQIAAWFGDGTPFFLTRMTMEQIDGVLDDELHELTAAKEAKP